MQKNKMAAVAVVDQAMNDEDENYEEEFEDADVEDPMGDMA